MKITKYPEFRDVVCSNCNTEFTLNKADYRKGRVYSDSTRPHKLLCKCPVCHEFIELGSIETCQIVKEDIDNIFKGTAEEVNNLPATETRHIVAKTFNELYNKIQKYFEDKFGLEVEQDEEEF